MHRKQLGKDCAGAFEFNDLAMLCLCGVGTNKLDENLDAHLGNSAGFQDKYGGQNVNRWLEQVIHECCKTSIDLQAYVLGPYAIVLDKSVCCFETSPRLTGHLVTYPAQCDQGRADQAKSRVAKTCASESIVSAARVKTRRTCCSSSTTRRRSTGAGNSSVPGARN